MEIYGVSVVAPNDSYPEDGPLSFTYTKASPVIGCRLKYRETPPAEVFPKASPRLSQPEIRKEPLSHLEIGTWTEQDLQENYEFHFYANNAPDGGSPRIYQVREDQTVKLRFELFGTPYVHYGIVFFVDNQPVAPQDGAPILVDVENGQKTVVEAQLDMTGFDTESVLYAILVPRNAFTSKVPTAAFVDHSFPIFLLEGASEDYTP